MKKYNKKRTKKKKKDEERKRIIRTIIIIIIIILLLLHGCILFGRRKTGERIDLCTGDTCKKPDKPLVNCLSRAVDSACILPDFTGKTTADVNKWLSKISNNIVIKYEYIESDYEYGTIISQSVEAGTSVSKILDENLSITIYISKGKGNTPVPDNPQDGGKSNNNKNNNNSNNTFNDNSQNNTNILPEEPEEKELIVKDKNTKWGSETELNIFENSMYDSIIAPESSNTYQFFINNNTDSNVKYNITFTETNNYNINMKYKLRKNNSYIVDSYVSISDITLSEQLLDSGKDDTYYLEWKWISNDNDTDIGATQNATYNLKIEVEAEGIDE